MAGHPRPAPRSHLLGDGVPLERSPVLSLLAGPGCRRGRPAAMRAEPRGTGPREDRAQGPAHGRARLSPGRDRRLPGRPRRGGRGVHREVSRAPPARRRAGIRRGAGDRIRRRHFEEGLPPEAIAEELGIDPAPVADFIARSTPRRITRGATAPPSIGRGPIGSMRAWPTGHGRTATARRPRRPTTPRRRRHAVTGARSPATAGTAPATPRWGMPTPYGSARSAPRDGPSGSWRSASRCPGPRSSGSWPARHTAMPGPPMESARGRRRCPIRRRHQYPIRAGCRTSGGIPSDRARPGMTTDDRADAFGRSKPGPGPPETGP